jgi:CRP-like cAMP-binding protein
VKLQVRGGRQKERIISLVGPGECFCMASVFLDLPCPVTAVVLESGRLLSLKREAVIEAATLYPPLLLRLLGRLSLQLYEQIRTAESDAASSSAERVVQWLLSRLASARGQGTIALHVSKKTVAGSLNVTPETFSRVLRQLREQGLIEVGTREIRVVDPEGLRAVRPRGFGASANGLPGASGAPPAGEPEIDALHWLERTDPTGDVPHWFREFPDGAP